VSHLLSDALGSIEEACAFLEQAEKQLDQERTEIDAKPGEWPELDRLIGYVRASRKGLEGHVRDDCSTIKKAIGDWEKESDRLADLADGQSY